MIPIVWIIGGAIASAGLAAVVAKFWKEITRWISRAAKKIREAVEGFKIFLKKVGNKIVEIVKFYSRSERGRWQESVVTREIPESEVPEEIRAKVRSSEKDFTGELKRVLN